MRHAGVVFAVGLLALGAGVASGSEADLNREIGQLRAKVKTLERRVAELEAQLGRRPGTAVPVKREPVVDGPLDDAQRAGVNRAQAKVSRLAAELRKHGSATSGLAKAGAKAAANWATSSRELIALLASYGQASACLSALAKFSAGRNASAGARRVFEQAALQCAGTFAARWQSPDSAMRIAATYGPRSRDLPTAWGELCENCGAETGKRAYKELALRCYLRSVVMDTKQPALWKRVRRLEAELKRKAD